MTPQRTKIEALLAEIHDLALPDVWGEGALFGFSGLDGETDSRTGLIATFGAEKYDLLFHTPGRCVLEIRPPKPGIVIVATGDVLIVDTPDGWLCITYAAWHTLIGLYPEGTHIELRPLVWLDEDGNEHEYLSASNGQFVFSYGTTQEEAEAHGDAARELDVAEVVRARLESYTHLPKLPPGDDRLLKKCFSVMRVNTLAPEGVIRQTWSTPDRVPHKRMWLWDSAFHSLAMNRFNPEVAFGFLLSVLDTQRDDGMIPHFSGPDGRASRITQPPILAWGVWENYRVLQDDDRLHEVLPELERYLEWNLANRDQNHNQLLEWFIEGDPLCRSGESGLDNSPRFDEAILLDAVDFSTFQARDMACVAQLWRALGEPERAVVWEERAAAMRHAIHTLLWDDESGFYYDRDFDGCLSSVMAVTGFLPLLLEDIPVSRVDRLIDHLKDPATFGTAFPIPSVTASDPRWSTDMWRGATWINLNYLVIRGLRLHQRRAEADWLTGLTIAHVGKYYERCGVLFEFFDAKDERPPTQCDRKGPHQEPYDIYRKMDSIRDYHWTAALTALLLLERNGIK
ncbi:MAG: amylo-alpha-1,6-glucosidase [Anaerolineae bacterium]